jgi:hypothetical protein
LSQVFAKRAPDSRFCRKFEQFVAQYAESACSVDYIARRKAIQFAMRLSLILSVCVFTIIGGKTLAQSQYESSTDFAKYAMKLRENALLKIEPK